MQERDNIAKFRPKKVASNNKDLNNIKSLYQVTANDPIGIPIPIIRDPIPYPPIIHDPIPEPVVIDQPTTNINKNNNQNQLNNQNSKTADNNQNQKTADLLSEISDKLTNINLAIADDRVKQEIPFTSGVKTIPISTPFQPNNPFVVTDGTVPGYTVENVSKEISSLPNVKTAPKIYLTCYGPGSMFAIFSSDGRNYSTKETFIPEGSNQIFYQVYDLRLRSETEGCQYQLSQNEIPLQRMSIIAAEKIETYSSVSTIDFTGFITMGNIQTANIAGLISQRYFVRGVNFQSIQPLDFNLLFFATSTFDTPGDLDTDSFLDSAEFDMSQFPAFRINFANQFRLSVTDLNIMYEDADNTNTLHVALQNLSPIPKLAGPVGAVQMDFKMSPRI